ncbi:MAG: hypothetical protein KC910_09885 [Candidatus Eremiobacteraeota bacterium]|nr:hypothetical protein [Candidatus Eremiobacteraeota bacterium]
MKINGFSLNANSYRPEKLTITSHEAPSDSVFLGFTTVAHETDGLVMRQATLRNGLELTEDLASGKVTVAQGDETVAEYQASKLRLPQENRNYLVVENNDLEQRVFHNGGILLVDHAQVGHHLDTPPRHRPRGFQTDQYLVTAKGAVVGQQYAARDARFSFRSPHFVTAWLTSDGSVQVPRLGANLTDWKTLKPFVTNRQLVRTSLTEESELTV